MNSSKKLDSLKNKISWFYISTTIWASLVIIASVTLGIVFLISRTDAILLALVITLFAGIILFAGFILLYFKAIDGYFYNDIFLVTKDNLNRIKENKGTLFYYPRNTSYEFNELNECVEEVEKRHKIKIVCNRITDYSYIPLQYVHGSSIEVTYSSLEKNYRELIYVNASFRNAFITLRFPINENPLSDNEKATITQEVKTLLSYSKMLIAYNEKNDGILIYIPRIDSVSRLKEEVFELIKNTPLNRQTPQGMELVSAKACAVIYPYSNIEDIFSDLRYAQRQNRNMNFYLPAHLNTAKNDNVLELAMNINNMTKIVNQLSSLTISTKDIEQQTKDIFECLQTIALYLDIDTAGIIRHDNLKDSYSSMISYPNNDEEAIFKKGSVFSHEIIDLLGRINDDHQAYFFSDRTHVNNELGRYLDIFGVRSGYIYTIKMGGKIIGLVYFFNKDKSFNIDSYLRESLFIASSYIGVFLKEINYQTHIDEVEERSSSLLKLTHYLTYTVDRESYILTYLSDALGDTFPKAKTGNKCYAAFYGRETPCPNCPLLKKKKTVTNIAGHSYEASLTLENRKDKSARILLTPKGTSQDITNRFDHDLLINSFFSLTENIKNAYFEKGKGYLLLLNINNIDEILTKYGSEGYSAMIRAFAKDIRAKQNGLHNTFLYRDNTLAVLIPECGRIDIVNFCEAVYDLSKQDYMDDGGQLLPLITYLAMKYPQDYVTADDLLHHTDKVINTFDFEHNDDIIYLEEDKYKRSASKKDFILSVIDASFGANEFKVKMQPMINVSDSRVTGAEILLRLSDTYRNITLDTNEMIKVAEENNKISVISNALINFIGNMYQQHGYTVFRTSGLNRISVNTSYSYFSSPDFLTSIEQLMTKYVFQKDFLTFEIGEKDLYEHYSFYQNIIPKIIAQDILIVCDQYTGEFLSLDKIKTLGCKEIKIPRFLVTDIESNVDKSGALREIILNASNNGIRPSVVGVENKEQFNVLKAMRVEISAQGYYFYAPLDTNELIDALRRSNINN